MRTRDQNWTRVTLATASVHQSTGGKPDPVPDTYSFSFICIRAIGVDPLILSFAIDKLYGPSPPPALRRLSRTPLVPIDSSWSKNFIGKKICHLKMCMKSYYMIKFMCETCNQVFSNLNISLKYDLFCVILDSILQLVEQYFLTPQNHLKLGFVE